MTRASLLAAATAPRLVIPSAMLAAVLLRLPALSAGLRGDDYVQAAMLRGDFPGLRQPWDLFRFAGPGAADNAPLIDFGYLPWWSTPDLSLAMFRPLASVLIALDHALFGNRLTLHHAHSLAWCAVAVGCAGLLYFRLLPRPAAALATLVFAGDEAHSLPATWLANRSTLIASSFGILALYAYAKTPTTGRSLAMSLLALAAATAAGEYGVCFIAYFAALVLTQDASMRQRALALGLAVAVVAGYLGLRAQLGHGVRHSGLYLNVVTDLPGYLSAAPTRFGMLMADLVIGLPAIDWVSGGGWRERWWYATRDPEVRAMLAASWEWLPRACGAVAMALYLVMLGYVGRRRDVPGTQPFAHRALGVAALPALLVFTPAVAEDRLTMGASLGVSAVIALTVVQLAGRHRLRVARWAAIAVLVTLHLVWAPFRSTARSAQFARNARAERAWALEAPVARDGPRAAGHPPQRTYVLGAAEFLTAANLPFARAHYGGGLPSSYRRLTGARTAQDLTRVDAHTLDMTMLTHSEGTITGSLYRAASEGLAVGHRFAQEGLSVEVMQSQQGHPIRLRLSFDRPLEDPSLRFLHGTRAGLRPVALPAEGETLRLSPAVFVPPPARPAGGALAGETASPSK